MEEKINELLWRMIRLLTSLTPPGIKKLFFYTKLKFKHAKTWLMICPWLFLKKINHIKKSLINTVREIDVKDTLHTIEDKKNVFVSMTPVIIKRYLFICAHLIKKPFKDFTPHQNIALILCSLASLGAVALIYVHSQRIYLEHTKPLRAPASAEVLEFDRPEYYKKELRRVPFYGLKVPLYFPEVNQLQSVSIDFAVTFSNRTGKFQIEKREFQVRDHLINSLEPVLAEYALDEEGKGIIKEKIAEEIQNFMNQYQIPSKVEEVTIVYILAN